MKKMYIVLSDGHVFEGKSFGAYGESLGELVFTTGMVGYIETLTDPSYYGQIVMHTFPLIGNYGMIKKDMESASSVVKGYVVREWCQKPSNFRSEGDIDSFLKENNIVGVYDVDTREITKIIRENGVMNAYLTPDPSLIDKSLLNNYVIRDAVKSVSTQETAVYSAEKQNYKVALIDYGAKMNIIRELNLRGCTVYCLPYNTSAQEILALNVDGIMLSNGPGDPTENVKPIEELKKLLGKKPIFGICRGMQLINVAMGGTLIEDIPNQVGSRTEHRYVTPGTPTMHEVDVLGESYLFRASAEKVITVNSFHHQAVDRVAPTLDVIARSSTDQIVEAVQANGDDFLVAVQWHPERIYQGRPENLRLVEFFIEAAQKRS